MDATNGSMSGTWKRSAPRPATRLDSTRAFPRNHRWWVTLSASTISIVLNNVLQRNLADEEQSLLDELRIIMEPSLREAGVTVCWSIEPGLPAVWADRQSLMQVFLNLIANSTRALSKKDRSVLSVSARRAGEKVQIEVSDNGGGVEHPEHLFRPFQAGAEATGLGLYLSRAFMRSFSGELRYQPRVDGACFTVELISAAASGQEEQ